MFLSFMVRNMNDRSFEDRERTMEKLKFFFLQNLWTATYVLL